MFNCGQILIFEEQRGNSSLSPEVRQAVYDMWVENCIPSPDARNSRCLVKISKLLYLKKYGGLVNKITINETKKQERCNTILC